MSINKRLKKIPLSSLQKYMLWSFIGHFTVFLFFSLTIAPNWKKSKKDEVLFVSLPKGTSNTLGSPLKKSSNLPSTTIQEQKEYLKAAPMGEKKSDMTYKPKETPKPTQKKPVVKPKTPGNPDSRIQNALARMQAAAKKEAVPEAAQVPDEAPGGFTFGNSNGPYVAPNDPEYVMYQLKVRQRIMDQWIIPQKYTEQNLQLICKIVVHINDRGEVTQTEWEQKSGDPSYDMSALRAVEKAAPIDIPPERLKYEVFNEGFIVEFNPSAKK